VQGGTSAVLGVLAGTGNPLSWVEFDAVTFDRMIADGDPLIGELRRDAHWLVAPPPPVSTALATAARPA
jgi:hypothetical protein